jgi:HEAT repeat protein
MLHSLKDLSWEVRQSTANALGRLGDHSAVDGLCELVHDPDRDVRESVINALAQIGDRRAVVPLVLALLDPESTLRSAALATLIKLDRHWDQNEDIRKVLPKIVQATKHQDYWVRFSAGKLLEQLNLDPNQLPEPVRGAPAEPNLPGTPDGSTMAEPGTDSEAANPAIAILADLLFDRDQALRLAAAEAFGRLRDKSTASLLTAALRDQDTAVRQAAQNALGDLSSA